MRRRAGGNSTAAFPEPACQPAGWRSRARPCRPRGTSDPERGNSKGRISLSCKSVSYVCGGSVGNPWLTWSRASQPGGKQRPPARGARQVHVARPEPRSFRAARMPPSTAGRMPAATACNKLRCAQFKTGAPAPGGWFSASRENLVPPCSAPQGPGWEGWNAGRVRSPSNGIVPADGTRWPLTASLSPADGERLAEGRVNPETAVGKPRKTRNTSKDRTKGCWVGSADVHLTGGRLPEMSGLFFVSLRGFRGWNRFFQGEGLADTLPGFRRAWPYFAVARK